MKCRLMVILVIIDYFDLFGIRYNGIIIMLTYCSKYDKLVAAIHCVLIHFSCCQTYLGSLRIFQCQELPSADYSSRWCLKTQRVGCHPEECAAPASFIG